MNKKYFHKTKNYKEQNKGNFCKCAKSKIVYIGLQEDQKSNPVKTE